MFNKRRQGAMMKLPKELLKLPPQSFADIAIALHQIANNYVNANGQLELFTHRMIVAGGDERSYMIKLREEQYLAEMLGAAHYALKALADYEDEVREILQRPARRYTQARDDTARPDPVGPWWTIFTEAVRWSARTTTSTTGTQQNGSAI